MLKGFEEDFAGIDLPDEVKTRLIEAANKRASGLVTKNDELLSKLSVSKSSATESQGAVEKLAALEALQAQQEFDGKVMVGDISLSDAIKEWAETDQGKAVRLAPDNSGGNSSGGTSRTGSGAILTDSDKRAADINKRFGKTG